jgi:signal transduction histidine kinase
MAEPALNAATDPAEDSALAALLADVAGAGDLEEAARRLAAGIAVLSGVELRGAEARILALDEDGAAFVLIGATADDRGSRRIPVADATHPAALAGLGLMTIGFATDMAGTVLPDCAVPAAASVGASGASGEPARAPSGGTTGAAPSRVAVPLPQPLVLDSPAHAIERGAVCARLDRRGWVVDDGPPPGRRIALAPFGVALVTIVPGRTLDALAVRVLARAGELVGPILARHARHVRRGGTLARRAADTRVERAKNEFLASVSHELRTPIHAILGYASLLLDEVYGPLPARQRAKVERVHDAAEQLLTLVTDILDVARIEAGRLPVRLEATPLPAVLQQAGSEAALAARAKGLTFTLEVAPEVGDARTDAGRLAQLLGHLLGNAVKFTAAGTVTLRAQPDGDRVRVDVQDTGIGIPASQLEAIWDDFHQVDQSRTREHGGTGLGLGIVRRLATTLGVELRAESHPGQGTTMSAWIPTHGATRTAGSDEPSAAIGGAPAREDRLGPHAA